MLLFLHDPVANELQLPRRAGTLPELLGHLRHIAADGLPAFPALGETLGRTLASLALLAVASGRPSAAQQLLGELVDLTARAAIYEETGPQMLSLYLRLATPLCAEPGGARLWEKGLTVLGALVRASVPESGALWRTLHAELRRLDLVPLAESIVLESSPLGWAAAGFGLDRGLREAVAKLAREVKPG
jgi:hypothetical protein